MNSYGTRVKHPMHRTGTMSFRRCAWCSKLYTPLGLSRHWDRCPVKKEAA